MGFEHVSLLFSNKTFLVWFLLSLVSCRDPAMADEQPTDGSFSTQFSAIRLRQVAEKQLNNKKRAILNKSSFGSLMNISPFSVPDDLIDWVVMKIDTKRGLFRYQKTPPSTHVFFDAMFFYRIA